MSGFFGTGGGLIILPALVHILKMDEYQARGTTLASILAGTLIASIFYAGYDYFDISLSIKVAIGGALGGYFGAKIMRKIPQNILSIFFDIFLIYVSIKMIIGG
ncbi:MAG: sulfite exporter TauE/SafE family protein [Clostridia bacterium]|nr:sulfite exporter TauE/SafE family protein [Clostridia bacterium]